MSIYRSILFVLGLLLCLGAASACSSEPHGENERGGTMRMPLQTTAPSGNVYQLRSATFAVFAAGSTTPTTTLTTSAFADPSAVLTAPLNAGSYSISLQSGWQVVRMNAAGTETPVAATLTSPNPAGFSIVANQTTNVGFAFDVPGDGSIGFGGNLGVSISVNEGGSGGGGTGTSFLLTAAVAGPPGVTGPIGNVQGLGISCGGGIAPDCTESFPAGTAVQLTASPAGASGLVFGGWSGAGCTDAAGGTATSSTITVTMTQPVQCTANFVQPQQQLALNVTLVSPPGVAPGTVSGPGIACNSSAATDCSESFAPGTSVQLTATGTAAAAFASWTGTGCTGATGGTVTTPTITVTMTQDTTCTATFQAATAAFPPASLQVEAWYSAEPAFITQSATGQISQWSDRSGFGRHLTQTATTAQPTFDPSGWVSGSGQGAVIFNGGQHLAAGSSLGSRFNGTGVPFTVLAVIRMAGDADGPIATFEQSGTGAAFMRMRVSDGGPFLRFQATNNAGTTFQNDENALLSLATGNVVSWVYTGTSSLLTTDGNPTDSAAISLGAITTDVFRVGTVMTGNPFSLNGRIAELIVANGAISASDYQSFRTYARAKWAGLP